MKNEHLTDEILAVFIEGQLDALALAELHAHIDCCDRCRELVAAMAGSYFSENPAVGAEVTSGEFNSVSTTQRRRPAEPLAPWHPPTEFDEFKVTRLLGKGTMGEVYLAHDQVLDRAVAIKFVAGVEPDRASRERFLREARAIARLSHQNVVAVHRVGAIGDRPYLVSEFVKGQGLDRLPKPAPWLRVLEIGVDLARGLSAAHRHGVLHRDIKPANAMVAEDGSVKLLDFGLAKLLDAASTPNSSRPDHILDRDAGVAASGSPGASTDLGELAGTPLYLAPERWKGGPASPQSDIYALGALLFELCTGRPPIEAHTLDELRRKLETETAPPLGLLVSGIDPGFAMLVGRCLHRQPAERPRSAEELWRGLSSRVAAVARPPLRLRRLAALSAVLVAGIAVVAFAPAGYRRLRSVEVLVPGGTFTMGSTSTEIEAAKLWCSQDNPGCRTPEAAAYFDREGPPREVKVSSFYLDRTEVTTSEFARWANLLRQNGRGIVDETIADEVWLRDQFQRPLLNLYPLFSPTFEIQYNRSTHLFMVSEGMEHKPIRQVTWIGASQYCREHGKRLPTEAEWEYAARGPERRRFPWGDQPPRCGKFVFALWSQEMKSGVLDTHPLRCFGSVETLMDVGMPSQDVTPLGIHDLGGNAGEWVADEFTSRYRSCAAPCRDPVEGDSSAGTGEQGKTVRVIRGGSYSNDAVNTRSAARSMRGQDIGLTDVGFRCARSGH